MVNPRDVFRIRIDEGNLMNLVINNSIKTIKNLLNFAKLYEFNNVKENINKLWQIK